MKLGENAKQERERIKAKFRELMLEGKQRTKIYEELGRRFGKSVRQIYNILRNG